MIKVNLMSNNTFDFVVIGGGLAGLVVATRLAEDPNVTVGVLEAGQEVSQSLDTNVPGFIGRSLANSEVTWQFLTTPQPGANNRSLFVPRGKSLGGSSNLNFMLLSRASATEYDAFESLGSKGWNWEELLKYFKKSEKMSYSRDDKHGVKPDLNFNGTSGPLFKTLPRWENPIVPFYNKTCENLGIPLNTNGVNGDTVGVWAACEWAIHPETATRVSSATAYYQPNKTKQNLVIITGAHVTRIVFNGKVAEAVEYSKGGVLQSVSVKKEVILSAGTFQTPQILELSGIGDEKILQSHGIPVVVNLPGVGKNYRKLDHWYTRCVFEIDSKYHTVDELADENVAAQEWRLYEEKKQGMYTTVASTPTFLPSKYVVDSTAIREVASKLTHGQLSLGVQKTLSMQQAWLEDDRVSQVEILLGSGFFGLPNFSEPGKRYMTLLATLLHPFCRGDVHLSSSDPLAAPAINPNVFDNDVDLDLLVGAIKLARKIVSTDPLRSVVVKEISPGTTVQTDEEIKHFVKNETTTVFHPVGTASMLPEADGGVVDANLKVYGIANLRVIDASIIPIQLGAHTQVSVYGIAEKGADIIKSSL